MADSERRESTPVTPRAGIISLFARHPNAPNLLMALMVIAGIYAIVKLNAQFLPDFGIDVVVVSVEWPGASAEDVDSNIVQAIEPEVRFIDSVKRVRSTSYENLASISVEFEAGADMQAALSDVESGVSRVTTLPEDSKTPEVRRIVRYDTICRLVISGPFPEASLKTFAKRIRDDLLARGVDKVDLFGDRDEEIWVEIAPSTLRRLDLTMADVAARIGETSQDLPSGDIAGGSQQVRSIGLLTTARGIEGVEVKALENGRKIYLRDIATVRDTFEEGGRTGRRKGERAIELHVQRATNADALKLQNTVLAYLDEVRPTLPASLNLEIYDVVSDLIRDRIDLLVWNGLGGLIIVVSVLFVFLNGRVAFWVLVGIPVSLFATLGVMYVSGQSINMISLFGLIMAIGIVVDDAIVVGEHAEARSRLGLEPLTAAITAAQRMAPPVFSASLTTICAFLPLLVITGIIGQVISAIPFVVVAVLIASLIECFLVLPGHLRGALGRHDRPGHGPYARFRRWFDGNFDAFRQGPFRRFVSLCVRWRYATLATTIAMLVLSVGLLVGGRVNFNFFPSPEADRVYANVLMVSGTSRERTAEMLDELERSLAATTRKLAGAENDLVKMSFAKLGTAVGRGPGVRGAAPDDAVGGLEVELKTADRRTVRTRELIAAWRKEVRTLPGLDTLTIQEARGGPPGRDIDIRLSGTDIGVLKTASNEVQRLLRRYPGVSDVEDDLPYGKIEKILEVTQRGRALDFTTESVGRQVRNAIEGAIAKRFARGDEEVTVRVQFPREDVGTGLLETLYLRSPRGMEVPLVEVVSQRGNVGFARIKRQDGSRQVAITAELDKEITSTGKVIAALGRDGLNEIVDGRDVRVEFAGRAEEREEAFADMRLGGLVGLAGIYIILAWVFASYSRPIVVMAIIPMGFVGAMLGHWLMDYNLTILSMVAMIGLSGIVINDSIILVTTVDERRKSQPVHEAIIDGACDRLRAIILTSATTIGGLTPLIFEKSLQAQFLIPMALTIVFGLAVATVLVLIVVPALIAVLEDMARLFQAKQRAAPVPAE